MFGHRSKPDDKPRPDPPSCRSAVKAPSEDVEFKISRLDLRPGDILVIRCKQHVRLETVDLIREQLRDVIGAHKVMILDGGADLAILTAAEIEKRSTPSPPDEATV